MTHPMTDIDDVLIHFGVKGMRWGVRKDRQGLEGVSGSTSREAKKDAREFARAKMFYGDGAGTRRKLIKATVNSKSQKDPSYKKAFDYHLESQDMGSHASKARGERRRKDVVSKTGKTARGVHRSLTGGFGSVSLASAVIAGGYLYARQTGADKVIMNHAKTAYSTARSSIKTARRAREWSRMFNG